jgi:hypothetical protein
VGKRVGDSVLWAVGKGIEGTRSGWLCVRNTLKKELPLKLGLGPFPQRPLSLPHWSVFPVSESQSWEVSLRSCTSTVGPSRHHTKPTNSFHPQPSNGNVTWPLIIATSACSWRKTKGLEVKLGLSGHSLWAVSSLNRNI